MGQGHQVGAVGQVCRSLLAGCLQPPSVNTFPPSGASESKGCPCPQHPSTPSSGTDQESEPEAVRHSGAHVRCPHPELGPCRHREARGAMPSSHLTGGTRARRDGAQVRQSRRAGHSELSGVKGVLCTHAGQ